MKHPDAITAFAALGHEYRLAIYRMLVEAGPDGLSAGVIAERLAIPPSSLTFHTQLLVKACLVRQRRVSRQLIYVANFETMHALIAYLTENCCGGQDRGCVSGCEPEDVFATALPKKRSRA